MNMIILVSIQKQILSFYCRSVSIADFYLKVCYSAVKDQEFKMFVLFLQRARVEDSVSTKENSKAIRNRPTLRLLTATAQGMKHWAKFKSHTSLLFEIFGELHTCMIDFGELCTCKIDFGEIRTCMIDFGEIRTCMIDFGEKRTCMINS